MMTDKTILELAQEILKSANGLSDEMRSSYFASAAEQLAQRVIEYHDMYLGPTGQAIIEMETIKRIQEQAKAEQREKDAEICGRLAYMMEHEAGELEPGARLRQAERMIRDDS